MTDIKSLSKVPFFSELEDNELEIISPLLHAKEFRRGDTIFSETEEGESLYILRKGEVKACRMTPDGELFTLTMMKEGDIFGEMSFLDGRPRSATIVAVTDIEVYSMERKEFEAIVAKHPWVVYKLLKSIVFTIHAIVRGMNTRYIDMINYMWGRKR